MKCFKTESDEDVIFVSEKCTPNSKGIVLDQSKQLALQREIDLHSRPKPSDHSTYSSHLTSQRSVSEEGLKMEDKKLIKKEKKLTKDKASLLEQNNSTVQDDSQAEGKKQKKKCQKVDAVVLDVEVESLGGGHRKEEKKKKKSKIVNDEEVSKKMKKKKLAEEETELETALSSKETKKRKGDKVKKSAQIDHKDVKLEILEDQEQPGKVKLAKKDKKGKDILIPSPEMEQVKEKKKKKDKKTTADSPEAADETNVMHTKNKAKTKKTPENMVKLVLAEEETGEADRTSRLKVEIKSDKVRKDKRKGKPAKGDSAFVEDVETEPLKVKGKKEKVGTASVEEAAPKKKKKRTKTSAEGQEEETSAFKCVEEEQQSAEPSKKVKQKKKKKTHEEDGNLETAAKKRKKIKEEVEDQNDSGHVDVVFLSEKSGNVDEVNINQERRLALQMEINLASQPKQAAKPVGLGQWGSAEFDSSEQQQKFLRLMGGLKKGPTATSASNGRSASMALGKGAQQQLQQGLMEEFDRAHSRRMDFSNRGMGLGFAAPSTKKFSIDINASRSVRFDD